MDQSLFLQQTIPHLSKALRVDLFEKELSFIREIEKTMESKKVFEEKWKIATSGDRTALAKYHSKLLARKATKISEAISNLSQQEYDRLNLQLEQFRTEITAILLPIYEHLKITLNEGLPTDINFSAAAPALDDVDFSKLEKGASQAAKSAPSQWTILGVINSIGKALTNNYSILGIFQLFLDILGIVGDAIVPGLGMAADLLNAIIYWFNGEYVLSIISLIGVIPGLGDAAKVAKPIARPLQKILGWLRLGKTKEAAELVAKTPGARNFLTVFLLPALKGLGKVFATVGRAIAGLFKYISSFIPKWLGGGYVTRFFKWIDDQIVAFKAMLDGIDSAAKKALDEAATAARAVDGVLAKEVAQANAKLLKGGGEVIEQGNDLIFKFGDGTQTVFPKSALLGGQDFATKFPGAKMSIDNNMALAFTVAKANSTPKIANWLSKAFSRRWNKKSLVGIGKLIYKYLNNGQSPDEIKIEGTDMLALDPADYAYVSGAALTDYVDQVIKARKEQTGEIYNPTVVFNSMDARENEGFDFTQSYLRDMAKKTGQPSIIPVIYDRYKTEMEDDEREALEETFETLSRPSNTSGEKVELEGIEVKD